MELSGRSVPVDDPRLETAGFYRTRRNKVGKEAESERPAGPPFLGVPSDLPTYRGCGLRRLDAKTHERKWVICVWDCRMPVEMMVDHWNPYLTRHRYEMLCYDPRAARSTGWDQHERFQGVRACPTLKRTGCMRTRLPIGVRTTEADWDRTVIWRNARNRHRD